MEILSHYATLLKPRIPPVWFSEMLRNSAAIESPITHEVNEDRMAVIQAN